MMRFVLNWFVSKTVRRAVDLGKTVRKIARSQRDLLKPEAIAAINESCDALRAAIAGPRDLEALRAAMTRVETVANSNLQPYPNAGMRENFEVALVAIGVALAIRTFVLQPFKIPTGSMQPTLYGITHESFRTNPDVQFPSGIQRWIDSWFRGVSYYDVVAAESGKLGVVEEPRSVLLPFIKKQKFWVGDKSYTVWFPPEELFTDRYRRFGGRAGLHPEQYFEKGESILKLKVISGDHLFVDRMTYNFRPPRRGEIIVFATEGIQGLEQDQFYIKRLVGLGGETLSIDDTRHVHVNGERLDAATHRFEFVYSFGENPPMDSRFSGHVNGRTAAAFGHAYSLSPLYPTDAETFTIRTNHFVVMGDNTVNSLDSRAWGDFTRTNVIGRSAFVYWPFLGDRERSSRFGWSHR